MHPNICEAFTAWARSLGLPLPAAWADVNAELGTRHSLARFHEWRRCVPGRRLPADVHAALLRRVVPWLMVGNATPEEIIQAACPPLRKALLSEVVTR